MSGCSAQEETTREIRHSCKKCVMGEVGGPTGTELGIHLLPQENLVLYSKCGEK